MLGRATKHGKALAIQGTGGLGRLGERNEPERRRRRRRREEEEEEQEEEEA